jgi:prepilin-type N-terminal cleavage/methylation domain-containing protein
MMYKASQSGFTLVETLVAITILLIIIVGPMTIVSKTTSSTGYSSEQVQAFFLAQEGAEIVQKVRDDLLLEDFADVAAGGGGTDPWEVVSGVTADPSLAGWSECFNNGCGLELVTDAVASLGTIQDCSTLSDCRLYYDKDTVDKRARYTHDPGGGAGNEDTPFTRVILLANTAGQDEIRVTSRVTWRNGNTRETQKVEVVTYLLNVYDN